MRLDGGCAGFTASSNRTPSTSPRPLCFPPRTVFETATYSVVNVFDVSLQVRSKSHGF